MLIIILSIVALLAIFLLYKAYQKDVLRNKVEQRRNTIKKEDSFMEFPLGDILSLYTGKELSPRGRAGIHRILDYLHGQELYDYQLAKKAEEAIPWLNQQFPEFKDLRYEDTEDPNYWTVWLDDQITRFGLKVEVMPIPLSQLNPETNEEAWKAAKELENLDKISNLKGQYKA